MITFESRGNFNNTDAWLKKLSQGNFYSALDKAGAAGVQALSSATPVDSGLAATSWSYEVQRSKGSATITWSNSDTENGFPVVIMLQYGHGTGTGGYVQGRDFINPAIKPIFDKLAEDVWKVVTTT